MTGANEGISVEIGEASFSRVFASPADLENFITSEETRLSWLRSYTSYHFGKVFIDCQEKIRLLIDRWRQTSEPAKVGDIRAELISALSKRLVEGSLPLSESPDVAFILQWRSRGKRGDFYALGAMHAAFGVETPSDLIQRSGFIEGLTHGLIYRLGITSDTAKGGKDAVDSLVKETRESVKSLTKETSRADSQLRTKFKAAKRGKKIVFDFLRRETVAAKKELEDKLRAIKGEMAQLKKDYATELALQQPIVYWENRSKHFQNRARWLCGMSYGALAAAVLLIGGSAWLIVGDTPAGSIPEFWRLTTLAALSALLLWAVRLTVRLWFSNLHLATDAQERKLMIETFLSMRRGDFAIKDEDSRLVLQHIYRSASDGIVKDDAAPSTIGDLLGGRSITIK